MANLGIWRDTTELACDKSPFPLRLVAAAFITMAILAAASAAASFRTDAAVRQVVQSQLVVQSHSERLISAGRELELLVHLAVRTGDPEYATRYRHTRNVLHQTVQELKRAVVLPGNARAAALLEQAKLHRLTLQDAAINHAASGEKTAGLKILGSPAYQKLSRVYEENASLIQSRSNAYVGILQKDLDRSSFFTRLAGLVGIPLIAIAWLLLVGPARRWGREMGRVRASAESAAKAKAEFLATMSHEIRTPLNSIIGYTEMLLVEDTPSDERRHRIELIQEAGNSLLTVVDDILDYSAIESGKLSLNEQGFNLTSIVDNAVSIVRGLALSKGLNLTISMDQKSHGSFVGDQNRLRQILLNLLNNAIKFTPSGQITLTVAHIGEVDGRSTLRFSVSDTGIGIAEEQKDKLFDRFVQADSSITREYGGTGLGLSICKRLVNLMGGEIGFQSVYGLGSTFWFTVSLAPATVMPMFEEDATASEANTHLGQILLVEDVAANRELASAMLRHLGFRVEAVSDGAEAVEAVASGRHCLVLMDIQMPRMDGMSATRAIRGMNGKASEIPIIAMTANVLPRQIREFRAAGMNGFIAKPIQMTKLAEEIRRALASESTLPICNRSEVSYEPRFESSTYSQITDLLSPDRLLSFLDSLSDQLTSFKTSRGSGAATIAHKLVAQAGYLGFQRLSTACADFEQAVRSGGIDRQLHQAVTVEAEFAHAMIAQLKSRGGADRRHH